MWRIFFSAATGLWLSVAAFGQHEPRAATNLVTDGGFEKGGAGWQFLTSGGANAAGHVDETEKHEGKYAYKLSNKSGFAPNVYGRIVQVVSGLRPYSTYRVSCWARGRACGINWIGGGPGWMTRHPFPKGDFDWQAFSFEIECGSDPDNYELMVLTESQTEALWVDDIRFELVKVDWAREQALLDLLSDESLNPRAIPLEPMVPRLLRLRGKAETRP